MATTPDAADVLAADLAADAPAVFDAATADGPSTDAPPVDAPPADAPPVDAPPTDAPAGPSLSACAPRTPGLTCEAHCASLGASCVAAGCGGLTYQLWGSSLTCSLAMEPVGRSSQACDTQLPALASTTIVRCCCAAR